jgi:Zn-finger nucleic acid-binding protein
LGFVNQPDDSFDRLTPLEEPTDWHCPKCESPLKAGTLDELCVVYCDQCQGILIGCHSFAQVIRSRRARFAGPESTPKPLDANELERQLHCPRCGQSMEVHPYYGPGNVVIDSCASCQVVWLDYGEVGAIERAPGLRQAPQPFEPPKPVKLASTERGAHVDLMSFLFGP